MNPAYKAARDIVVSMLSNFPDGSLTIDVIRTQVANAVRFVQDAQHLQMDAELEEKLVKELEATFNVWIGRVKILEDDTGHQRWLDDRREEIEWRFWDRYSTYLQKTWATPAASRSLETLTDDILGRLEDPQRQGEWDRRGLVVGHVQSGKTANYTGLICKAADAGYKLIVVLAGMHNNLRSQTQVRLEEGFLGYNGLGGEAKQLIGVGLVDPTVRADAITDRTDKGDFSKRVAQQFNIAPGQRPLLFVVKKNASTLKNLLAWVQGFTNDHEAETGRRFVKDVPILVIDDEADQASVNSKKLDDEPTKINSLVRQLLFSFAQSAYVGYTATPFANIFIHESARKDAYGQDLFPRSFILSLPTPSNYVGPTRVFGLNGDPDAGIPDTEPMPLVRSADDGRDWIPDKHRKDIVPVFSGEHALPPSLHEAMLSFVLAGAAKAARGMGNQHHSMLVHVTRFTDVQTHVARQVGEHLKELRERLIYGEGEAPLKIMDELRTLWTSDFSPTTEKMIPLLGDGDADLLAVSWLDVAQHIRPVLSSIEVRVINGTSADALEYEEHQATGIRVIAIGGDKLSRGLTLEGLSTSYFLRSSKMYDTLMQMGRWFGYRPGYVDLCRLYLPEDIKEWFEHITEASEELRREFDYMAITGGTPRDYGLRVKSHPTLLITSQVKMRAGVPLRLSFAGQSSETVVFPRAVAATTANFEASENLVKRLGAPTKVLPTSSKRVSGKIVWSDVAPTEVTRFLRAYHTHALAWRVNRDLLAEFIEKQVAKGDLVSWTVCLVSSSAEKAQDRDFGGFTVGLTTRANSSGPPHGDRLTIRRLLSPTDEAIDLSEQQSEEALALTRATLGDQATLASGRAIRSVRSPKRGLLLLYPLDPADIGGDKSLADKTMPVFGFGISFPEMENAETVDYKVNHVYWEQYYGANDWNENEGEDECPS